MSRRRQSVAILALGRPGDVLTLREADSPEGPWTEIPASEIEIVRPRGRPLTLSAIEYARLAALVAMRAGPLRLSSTVDGAFMEIAEREGVPEWKVEAAYRRYRLVLVAPGYLVPMR